MKIRPLLAAALFAGASAFGATKDLEVNADLLPNTDYRVTADISTDLVSSLLTFLGTLGATDIPVQILDGQGNLLGQLSVADLTDLLSGLTGDVTTTLERIIRTGVDGADKIILRVIDTPVLSVNNVRVVRATPNQRPVVRVTGRQKRQSALVLRGTASDDSAVSRVSVRVNGKVRRAQGTTRWNSRLRLKSGVNTIIVRAVDNEETLSAPKRVRIRG